VQKHRNYDPYNVVQDLRGKGCQIDDVESYTINVSGAYHMGNKSWGKIDFLKNFHRYTVTGEVGEKKKGKGDKGAELAKYARALLLLGMG